MEIPKNQIRKIIANGNGRFKGICAVVGFMIRAVSAGIFRIIAIIIPMIIFLKMVLTFDIFMPKETR